MEVAEQSLGRLRRGAGYLPVLVCSLVGCSTFPGTTAKSFMMKVESSRDPNERYAAYEKLGSERAYDNEQQKAEAVALLSKKLARRTAAREEWFEPAATRAIICRTLGRLRHSAARDAVLAAASDTDPLVRAEACRALGSVGKKEDATVLARVAAVDTTYECRFAAIEGLGEMKAADPRIAAFLVNTMEGDEDPGIRYASLGALRKITGKDFGVEAKPWNDYLVSITPQPTSIGPALPPRIVAAPRAGTNPAPPSLDGGLRPAAGVRR